MSTKLCYLYSVVNSANTLTYNTIITIIFSSLTHFINHTIIYNPLNV
jgi:hypothetical protein